MAPRARRVRQNIPADQISGIVPDRLGKTPAAKNLKGSKKRTLSTTDPITSTLASTAMHVAAEPPPNKRARNTGPTRGRPMQLRSRGEVTSNSEQGELTAIGSAKGKANVLPAVERPSVVAPVHHAVPSPMRRPPPLPVEHSAHSDNENTDSDDGSADTEFEWLDESLAGLTPKFTSKVSEAIVIERPLWQVSSDTPFAASRSVGLGASSSVDAIPSSQEGSVNLGAASSVIGIPASQGGNGSNATDPSLDSGPPQCTWPSDTDIVYIPGTKRCTLTIQRSPLRAIIPDAFENLQAFLLFDHAFPDATALPTVIRGCLVAAAAHSQVPLASDIRRRLIVDDSYLRQLSRLPRARVPIYRSEIKERCAAVVQATFLAVSSPPTIAQIVTRQLSGYTYTFPMAFNNDPLRTLPMRTKPYRNPRIIGVMRELYFLGGFNSFAHQYRTRFPTSEDDHGDMILEVPVPMVALVATALYAALYEWRTGVHHPAEFSANAYLDVYNGHVQTFTHIFENRKGAFHNMMGDIYMRASDTAVAAAPGVPIAELNLEELDD